MKIKFLMILLISFSTIFSQTIENVFQRITDKLKEDETYLNLYSVNFTPVSGNEINSFRNIPTIDGGTKSFENDVDGNITYKIIYMPENVEFDDPVILFIQKETQASELGANILLDTTDSTGFGNAKVEDFLNFLDIQYLYYNHPEVYKNIFLLADQLSASGSVAKVFDDKIVAKEIKKSKGITARDNQDFLNFNWTNNDHYYPKIPKKKSFVFSRRAKADKKPIRLSVNFDKIIAFYPEWMEFENNSISVELTTATPLLNLQPYESMSLSGGLRSLIFLGKNKSNMMSDFIIDAKILGHFPINTRKMVSSLPFLFADEPKLNTSSGLDINLSLTRAWNLPFLTFYLSSSSENYDNPYYKFGSADSSYAYFAFDQWSAEMSFFWNTNELRNLRLRMDVGVGRHIIKKGIYYNGVMNKTVKNTMNPIVKFSMTFVPNGEELFFTGIRYYDNVFKLDFWLKLVGFDNNSHLIRITASHFTKPIGRTAYEWENKGSTFLGINYRYGY